MALLQLLQRLVLSVARVMERNDGMSFDRMGLNRMWFGRDGLTERVAAIRRKQDAPAGTCSLCFRAGTLVWAATGLVAIESLAVGDDVLVVAENARAVGDGSSFEGGGWPGTIGEDVEGGTHAASATTAGSLTVVRVRFDARRETVYNLTVADTHTYLVGEHGVWVHNCTLVDNLNRDVVDKAHHSWSKLFSSKPSVDDVRPLLMNTITQGKAVGGLIEYNKGGRLIGMSQRYEYQHGSQVIWEDAFLDESANATRLMNGGVK